MNFSKVLKYEFLKLFDSENHGMIERLSHKYAMKIDFWKKWGSSLQHSIGFWKISYQKAIKRTFLGGHSNELGGVIPLYNTSDVVFSNGNKLRVRVRNIFGMVLLHVLGQFGVKLHVFSTYDGT